MIGSSIERTVGTQSIFGSIERMIQTASAYLKQRSARAQESGAIFWWEGFLKSLSRRASQPVVKSKSAATNLGFSIADHQRFLVRMSQLRDAELNGIGILDCASFSIPEHVASVWQEKIIANVSDAELNKALDQAWKQNT